MCAMRYDTTLYIEYVASFYRFWNKNEIVRKGRKKLYVISKIIKDDKHAKEVFHFIIDLNPINWNEANGKTVNDISFYSVWLNLLWNVMTWLEIAGFIFVS